MIHIIEDFVREELTQDNAHIAAAVLSMLDAGGKHLRPRITKLAGRACNTVAPEDSVLASYMELIHVATLIHDDVVDAAKLRRGRPTTNETQGNRFSVLAGDYLFAWVFKKITQTYADPIPNILSAMLAEICNGQVRELRAIGDVDLTVDGYSDIIGKKTAALFAACAEVGAIAALQHQPQIPHRYGPQRDGPRRDGPDRNGPPLRENPLVKALRAYGWAFGMAFQIRDDLLDVVSSESALGKPAGSDLREGKVTLPLIYALERENAEFRGHVVRLFSLDDPASEEAVPLLTLVLETLKHPRIIERTRESVAGYIAAAWRALGALAESPPREELAGLAGSLMDFSS